MNIRPFKTTDMTWLIDQLSAFAKFYGTQKSLFLNEDNTEKLIQNLADNHVLFLAEQDGEPYGFIAGFYTQHLYNPQLTILTEAFFWVEPKNRQSRAAIRLLNKFVEFGEKHADFITLTLEHDSPMSDRHFLKRGFHLKEKNYFKECK